jgi:DNA helicase HerA-like ATPase
LTITESLTDIEINKVLEESEKVGTIGSPSTTTKLSLNLLGSATEKKLIGELAVFRFKQDNEVHYALGQITDMTLKNDLLQDSAFQAIARYTGSVKNVSGIQDVHIASFSPSAVFSRDSDTGSFNQSILGTVPSTGTPVFQASNKILDKLLEEYENLFYLGHTYGSKNTKLPMRFKHFGDGIDGNGEAIHMGIFGATGSGKSTLAQRILMAYSRYDEMGLLVLDPAGQFSQDMLEEDGIKKDPQGSDLDYKNILSSLGKEPISINVRNLVLDRWDLFKDILKHSSFFQILTVASENKKKAIDFLVRKLRTNNIYLRDLWEKSSFDFVMQTLRDEGNHSQIYSLPEGRKRLKERLSDDDIDEELYAIWDKVCAPFRIKENGYTVDDLLAKFKNIKKPFVIVDLSSKHELKLEYWNETIKTLILIRLLSGLTNLGEQEYNVKKSLNTLVVLDEAHKWAGNRFENERHENTELQGLKAKLIDYVRTTRKYRLGWMFISTSLSSIDREILQQLKIVFFGSGLSLGGDLQRLKDMIPDDKAIDLYQSFGDPNNAPSRETKKFSFMCKGPVSPLSFSGFPLFINAFSEKDFIKENKFKSTGQ